MHTVKVQLQGYYEKKPVFRWDCTCGEKAVMHPFEAGAQREAQEHLDQHQQEVADVSV